jgi:hypothetical protein
MDHGTATAGRQTGRFVYWISEDKWEWDDGVYRIHGYAPGEVEPTTELFLRHKHDQDRERVRQQLDDAVATGEAFNLTYRLLVGDEVRRVVVVGGGVRGPGGVLEQLTGYYLDLTPEFERANAAAADMAVEASAAGRQTIEQAKGVLMLGYGLDGDAAFAMLRWWSRNRNVKVRELAERLTEVAQEGHASHAGLRKLLDTTMHDLTGPTDQPSANHHD